jgi:predicted dehydrogenase
MDYTIAAARAGKPVYVEKPMARHHDECLAMINACQSANVPLFVAYYRRALPRFLKIKELIDSGAIGEVRFVSVMLYQKTRPYYLESTNLPWRVQPEISGGGIYVDLASHILDILDFLLGPICEVQGVASNHGKHYPAEDIVTGHFVFESGVHGMGTWCFTAFEDCDQTEIVGSKGKISYVTFDSSPILLTTQEGITSFAIDNPPHIQQPLIQTIVDELNGVGRCPSTGESAARVNWVMDRMLESYYKK